MRSILGECTGNERSTPTPKDCLRTVNVSRAPCPWRLMTTPSKTWIRRREPSMTWKCTFTRSPGANVGTRRSCARSMVSMTLLMMVKKEVRLGGRGDRGGEFRPARSAMVADDRRSPPHQGAASGAARLRRTLPPFAPAPPPPVADPPMMPGEQDLGHPPAPVLGRAGVVGVLGIALERGAERLLDRRALVPQRSRQLAQHGVAHDHRRQLAAREHIATDRDH